MMSQSDQGEGTFVYYDKVLRLILENTQCYVVA